jgi:hypothetical protein
VKYLVEFPVITYLSITVDANSKEEALRLAEQSSELLGAEHAGGEPRVRRVEDDIRRSS